MILGLKKGLVRRGRRPHRGAGFGNGNLGKNGQFHRKGACILSSHRLTCARKVRTCNSWLAGWLVLIHQKILRVNKREILRVRSCNWASDR